MKKIISLISLGIVFLLTSCGGGSDTKPVYKFFAKINGTEWKTNEVLPSTTPTSSVYVSNLRYYTSLNDIYVIIKNPNTGHKIVMDVYLSSYATAVGKYSTTGSSAYFEPRYYIANNDSRTDVNTSGTFEVTKFTYDANAGKITNLSGKFSFTHTATHWDGVTRTTTVSEGELNNVSE